MKYKYIPPAIVKIIFPEFLWYSSVNKILLTFDDGPNPGTTEIILEELEKQKIKAVFFCVGNNISKYPELAKEIIVRGHEIANHTYNHKNILKSSNEVVLSELDRFTKTAEDVLGFTPEYFRPPHGRFDFRIFRYMKQYNLKNVMWSLLTHDYKNDLEIVKFSVQSYLNKNSIVVLHDSNKSKNIICDSIKLIASEASERSFEFGEPEECLK